MSASPTKVPAGNPPMKRQTSSKKHHEKKTEKKKGDDDDWGTGAGGEDADMPDAKAGVLKRQDSWGSEDGEHPGEEKGEEGTAAEWGDVEEDHDAITAPREVALISPATRAKIQGDIDEINMTERFTAKVDWMGGSSVRIFLAITTRQLNINQEQMRAWYLDPRKKIIVQLEFSPYYWEGSERPVVTRVGQGTGFDDIQKFGLTWMLEDRLKTQFLPRVPGRNTKSAFKVEDVKNLMELSNANALMSVLALQHKKNKINDAAVLLAEGKDKFVKTIVAETRARGGGFIEEMRNWGSEPPVKDDKGKGEKGKGEKGGKVKDRCCCY